MTTEALEDRWIGFKAVIYNFERDGNTYVRLESYIDDDVTDENGNLVIKNNWKLASVYEDRGDWETNDDDFDSSCGRDRYEILTQPGGTDTQNIAAWRSDDLSWSFKYLSVREIDPMAEQPEQPQEELPANDEEETLPPVEEPAPEAPNTDDSDICCELITSLHVTNDGDSPVVNSVEMGLKKVLSRTAGTITVAIVQNDEILGRYEVKTSALETTYRTITATFDSVNVTDEFDVVVLFDGSGLVAGYITQVN